VNVRASWRRVIQVKPYETEEYTLAAEGDYVLEAELGARIPADRANRARAAQESALLATEVARVLAEAGDRLVAERVLARAPKPEHTAPAVGSTPCTSCGVLRDPPNHNKGCVTLGARPAAAEPKEPDEWLPPARR